VVIDIAFPRLGHLSADYLKATREAVDWADVIVVSHPWVYPLIADRIRQSQLVVYDAHNVEGFLRAQLLDAGRPIERQLLREVVAAEYRAGLRADLVLVCSDEDRAMFERIYEWPGEKIRLAPNGVMAKAIVPASARERAEAKAACGLPADAVVAVFIGSAYGPNVEAARFIIENLAPSLPEIVFVILGGVGDCLGGPRRANLRVTGSVDDETKRRWLRASDLAVNPMFSGSGTNIKMFDFMAAGLPVITTAVGSRGIKHSGGRALLIVNRSTEDFVGAVRGLAADAKERASRGKSARTLVETSYSWERISQCLGELLRRSWRGKEQRERGQRKRMAMLTTWNTKCGIAEHASYLVQALGEAGWEVIVLGNQLPPDGPVNLNQEMLVPCLRVWTWDNVTWCSSDLDLEKTRGALAHLAPDLLCIQHHTGFISGERYAGVIRAAVELDLPVLVELHNARDLVRLDGVGTLSGQRVALIVHDATEQDLLATKTRLPITTLPLPVQIHSTRNAQPSAGPIERVPGTPLIGGFGFLRPYKGVKKAIRIVAALKRLYPEVRYVGYHASYQDGESGEYLRECLAEATRLGVTEAISIDTEFRDIGEIVDGLSRVDAVLLPYDELLEGASASANVAIAAGRPVVTSTAQIFNPLREVVLMVEGESTDAYVEVLDRLFRDGEFCERQARKTMRWAEEHSYDKAARRLIEVASRLM
jgi:glycosyltransferase involved in cell wall biosynthesis